MGNVVTWHETVGAVDVTYYGEQGGKGGLFWFGLDLGEITVKSIRYDTPVEARERAIAWVVELHKVFVPRQ